MEKPKQAKLGFIHIPKTAGSSINDYLGKFLCPEQFHLRALYKSQISEIKSNNGKRRLKVEFESELHFKLKEMDWVSGHISALAMEEFGRDFTFTVFRDRKLRALSQYRYGRWRWDHTKKNAIKIQGGIPPDVSFSDWLEQIINRPRNQKRFGHNLILGDKFSIQNENSKHNLDDVSEFRHEILLKRLNKIHRIYFPSELQEVLDNLSYEGLVPSIKLKKASRITQVSTYKRSEPGSISDLLNSDSNSISLENKIFSLAKIKFSQYWTGKEISDSEFLSICEKYRVI